jgi:hypothetical protein
MKLNTFYFIAFIVTKLFSYMPIRLLLFRKYSNISECNLSKVIFEQIELEYSV